MPQNIIRDIALIHTAILVALQMDQRILAQTLRRRFLYSRQHISKRRDVRL